MLRLGDEERGLLIAAASRAGLTPSGFAAAAALAAARGAAAPGSATREALLELVAARGAVARVGGNVNQIARALNADAEYAPAQLGAVLQATQRAAQRLDEAGQALLRRAQ